MIGWVGRRTIGGALYATDLTYFILQSLNAIRERRKADNVATARALNAQILFGGVEALELLGINLMDFFVAPRVLGMAIAQLVLATYFAWIALYGGVVLSGLLVSTSYFDYLKPLVQSITPAAVFVYAGKNLLFGL